MTTFDATFEIKTNADEEALAGARELIGPIRVEQWNTAATIDNIRHYAFGLGDINPLFHDLEYGRQSVQGTTVAPPMFLYSIYDGEIAPGLGGLLGMHRGSDWHFYDWVRLNDEVRATAELRDVSLITSSRGLSRIQQNGTSKYFVETPSGESKLVGMQDQTVIRMPGPGVEGGLNFEPRDQHEYSSDELEDIERQVLATEIRGADTRFWDDVKPGDKLGRAVKGPYTRMSMICYYAGAIGSAGYRAFDAWWRNRDLALNNPDALPNAFDPAYFAGTGISSMGHHDPKVGQTMGMPGAYDNGNQRVGLVGTCLTNWMGDDGFLYEYTHDLRLPVIIGDTMFIDAEVVDTAPSSDADEQVAPALRGRGEVSIALTATNQLGQKVSTGTARVLLRKR